MQIGLINVKLHTKLCDTWVKAWLHQNRTYIHRLCRFFPTQSCVLVYVCVCVCQRMQNAVWKSFYNVISIMQSGISKKPKLCDRINLLLININGSEVMLTWKINSPFDAHWRQPLLNYIYFYAYIHFGFVI